MLLVFYLGIFIVKAAMEDSTVTILAFPIN